MDLTATSSTYNAKRELPSDASSAVHQARCVYDLLYVHTRVARAEDDFNRVILSTTIRARDVYQQTLIVWTEPDGVDYALSFQDPEGCAEVWHFIEEVQRHMNAGAGDMALPIRGEAIQRKIHHTYRLHFLKDVVLARAIDDSTFNVLNSSIIFNQIDIITDVQNDQAFLREIARMFMDDDLLALLGLPTKHSDPGNESGAEGKDTDRMDVDQTDAKANGAPQTNGHGEGSSSSTTSLSAEELTRRREVVFLVLQLCMMGKNVQLPARMALFRALVDRGIVFAV
ncbi:component of IIS longevity pathway SMK-1-domain-containing protein [Earliella scabrosa]|nr:component of IIS longevity pathway SMK-1-domain-containing protein [Earliella scabrosa]